MCEITQRYEERQRQLRDQRTNKTLVETLGGSKAFDEGRKLA